MMMPGAWLSATFAVGIIAFGWLRFGWKGALVGVSLTVFWMLLQFNAVVRLMRRAGEAPVGHVDSAVMLQSRLKPRMRLLDVVALTGSLGERIEPAAAGAPERWRWIDGGGAALTLEFRKGRLAEWRLERPPEEGAPA